MMNLHDGYVVDVPYPTFVHRQAMPTWLNMVVQQQGIQAPDLKRPFRYLELGCAMGIHLHLTAAAHPQGHFVGVDFNAQQLLVAQEGIERTHISNIELIHASFSELLTQQLEPLILLLRMVYGHGSPRSISRQLFNWSANCSNPMAFFIVVI